MAQGQFTKQEAQASRDAVEEIMAAFPKKRLPEFLGHFNDLFLFLSAAEKAAPQEE
jgi:hypothetical protein